MSGNPGTVNEPTFCFSSPLERGIYVERYTYARVRKSSWRSLPLGKIAPGGKCLRTYWKSLPGICLLVAFLCLQGDDSVPSRVLTNAFQLARLPFAAQLALFSQIRANGYMPFARFLAVNLRIPAWNCTHFLGGNKLLGISVDDFVSSSKTTGTAKLATD